MENYSGLERKMNNPSGKRMLKDMLPHLNGEYSMAGIGRQIGRTRAAVQQFLKRRPELRDPYLLRRQEYLEDQLEKETIIREDGHRRAFELFIDELEEHQKRGKPHFYAFVSLMRCKYGTYRHDTLVDIFTEYFNGRSMNSIAGKHDLYVSAVRRLLVESGLETDPKKRKNYFKEI